MSSWEDLQETKSLVEGHGRRCVAVKADVRDRPQLRAALDDGVAQLGTLTTVCANAGILPMAMGDPNPLDFQDAVDVDLLGVMNAVTVAVPHLLLAEAGGSIIITGSTAAMMPGTVDMDPSGTMGPGGAGYGWAKKTLIGYAEQMALHLAPRGIRVNCIHPTNVNTHLLHNEGLYKMFRPDLEHVTIEDFTPASEYFQALPISWLEPEDVADLVLFLASDESKNITGDNIRIDAGSLLKFPNGPG
jgi:NAD(P)-dependent dehydrogenase (short-subunit alcohol dehydrogenase family)